MSDDIIKIMHRIGVLNEAIMINLTLFDKNIQQTEIIERIRKITKIIVDIYNNFFKKVDNGYFYEKKNQLKQLLKDFVECVERDFQLDLSTQDQDTTYYAVWLYLTTGKLEG